MRDGAAIVLASAAMATVDVSREVLPGGGVFLVLLIKVMLGAAEADAFGSS